MNARVEPQLLAQLSDSHLDALEEEAKDVEARAKAAEARLKELDQEFAIFRNEPVN